MTINALQLLLKNRQLGPNSIAHRRNGTTTLVWHVDDNDDRYVLIADSSNSEDFMLVVRDLKRVEAFIKDDPEAIIAWLAQQLRKLGASST